MDQPIKQPVGLAKVLTVLCMLCFLLLGMATGTEAETARVAKVEQVTGTVMVKKAGGTKEYKAFKSMSLNKGDQISTGPKSSVVLSIVDRDDEITVNENTVISLAKLQEAANGKQTSVQVTSGSAYIKVKSLTKQSDEFSIQTPTAIMGVRGTQLQVSVDPLTGKSSVFVAAGKVQAENRTDSKQVMVYPLMQLSMFDGGKQQPPASQVAFIRPEDLLNKMSPALLEAMIRNKAMMDQENDEWIEQMKRHLTDKAATGELPGLPLNEQRDLEEYANNMNVWLNNLVKEALANNKVSESDIRDLVNQVNKDLQRKIELSGNVPPVEWSELQQQEARNKLLELERERQRKALEEQKQRNAARENILQKIQEEQERLEKLREAARQQELDKLKNSIPTVPTGSGTGTSGGGGSSGSSGSGSGGSGGSGGKDKDPGKIVRIADLEETIRAGVSYHLPGTVLAQMEDGTKNKVSVTWEQTTIHTDKTGSFSFIGKVSDYKNDVRLLLHIYAPFGKPVKLHSGTMLFDKGFELDMGANPLPEQATVTIREVKQESALEQAGLVLSFAFEGIEVKQPVTLSYPLKARESGEDVGVFYKRSDDRWEYVHGTSVVDGRVIASVEHFSTYGVFHAPQAAPVLASPEAGLVDGNPDITLQTNTPGATIYYKNGGRYERYEPGSTIHLTTGAVEAYATADNMRDSEVARYAYTTVSASVKDSQHVELTFSEPIQSGSEAGVTLQNGRFYRFDIPAVNGSQTLAVASGTQISDHTVLLTLASDTSTMLQNRYVVKFYDESGSYAAQSNSFLLGYVPEQPRPQPEPEVGTIDIDIGQDGWVYIRWDQVQDAVKYEICLTDNACETLLQPAGPGQLEYEFKDFSYRQKYTVDVTAYNARNQIIAKGRDFFRVVAEPEYMNVGATATGSSVRVTWNEVSDTVKYSVCLEDTCEEVSNSQEYTFANVSAGSYEVKVRAFDEFDQVVGRGYADVTVEEPGPGPIPPPPPPVEPGPSPLVQLIQNRPLFSQLF
ncbi:Ig-like domain-containing protein [Brevibacillus parabrevis]|uniref:Ig-like domain-containing protein n=1 Tax=Brevibacillus parabrevis TaxID=54914 RepID=UPI0028530AA5|nr:Ig-like domain-containing protein [Brevibacillus parabrevis]MDR4997491.1 Ig-like domain-containing protein [Brevibacillus parabrevis]